MRRRTFIRTAGHIPAVFPDCVISKSFLAVVAHVYGDKEKKGNARENQTSANH